MNHINPDLFLFQVNSDIATDDLAYTSANGRYSFRFYYLGDGIFLLKANGYIEDKSFRVQLAAGDKLRQRLREHNEQLNYHLIWDVSEIDGISLISRSLIFSKIKEFNKISSVSFVGANNLSRSIGKMVSRLTTGLKFFYFMSLQEAMLHFKLPEHESGKLKSQNFFSAPESDIFSGFIDRWQEKKEYLYVSNRRLKVLYSDKWLYHSNDGKFRVEMCVVECNIIYIQCEGYARTHHVEKIYEILESILHEIGFNATGNKYYGIVNVRKLMGISIGGRKLTTFYEGLFRERCNMVIMVPSVIIQIFLKFFHLIRLENFSHWTINPLLDEAFDVVLKHREGIIAKQLQNPPEQIIEPELIIPATENEMVELLKKQHKEMYDLKAQQQRQIQKIIEISGRMSWDDSFSESQLVPDEQSPFNELYVMLHLLFQDFKDIVSEKSQHALLLKESEDKYRNLINLANDVIAVFQDGKIKFVNSRCKQVIGYIPNEIIGKGISDIVDISEQERLETYYKERINGGDVPWIYESVLIHKNGHQVPVSMSVGSLHYEKHPAVLLIIRDITENRKAEEELEKYRNHLEEIIRERTKQLQKEISDRKTAEESDRLKTSFLANMSHEIRTPMNAIIAFSNFLKNPELAQKERDEYLNYIQSSGETLLNLINDIIDISKIEAKQLGIQEVFCNVDSLLDELYKYFSANLKKFKKFDVGLQLTIKDRSQNTTIYTDVNRLKQILTNLLDNALKFTDSGSITFGYSVEDGVIIFFVKDTGIGIPTDKMNMIFRRFGKIDLSGRNFSGTGLGLAISHQLATMLQGKLWVDSKEGKGSTFWLKLPFQQKEHLLAEIKEEVVQVVRNYDLAGRKIMVVEDEDLNYKVLQIALQQKQVTVVRAENGKEAIDQLAVSNDIVLILMDIQMPIMDGYEAMEHIKKSHPSIPIIAQTAFAMMEERKHCLEMGFDDYISKPIALGELYEKVERLLK